MSDLTLKIGKLEAARRQLRTAITLWFNESDPVSVHTLAFAAYEIYHAISEKRNPRRRDLIFDLLHIRDEYRRDWNSHVRRSANFFKHADRDGDAVLDFNLKSSEFFILFAIIGGELCGESPSDEESIFTWWIFINKPHILTEQGRKMIAQYFPSNTLDFARGLTKIKFFEAWPKPTLAPPG